MKENQRFLAQQILDQKKEIEEYKENTMQLSQEIQEVKKNTKNIQHITKKC